MVLTKADLSKKYGVSRAAVTMAVKQGRLKCGSDGNINEKDPVNEKWIDSRKDKKTYTHKNTTKKKPLKKKEKSKKEHEEKKKEEKKAIVKTVIVDNNDSDLDDGSQVYLKKADAEVRYKREQIRSVKQKRLERLGELVERDLVRQVIGKLGAEIKMRLLGMPKVMAPRIVALVKSGEKNKTVQSLLEDEISKALKAAKEVLLKADFGNVTE
jgi:hypothetical protein